MKYRFLYSLFFVTLLLSCYHSKVVSATVDTKSSASATLPLGTNNKNGQEVAYSCYLGVSAFHISVYHTASFIYTDFFLNEHQQFIFEDTSGDYYHIRFGSKSGYIMRVAVGAKKVSQNNKLIHSGLMNKPALIQKMLEIL